MPEVDVSQDEFRQAIDTDLGSVSLLDASHDLAVTTGDAPGAERRAIVNGGSTVMELLGRVESTNGIDYANAVPDGVDPMQLFGWASAPHWLSVTWRSSSDWWAIWQADYDFTVGISFYYGGSLDGRGRYLDYASPYLDVRVIPPGFSIDVRCTVTAAPHDGGSEHDPVAVLPLKLEVTFNGAFKRAVSAGRTYTAELWGTGGAAWR